MEFADRVLTCVDCNKTFVFSAAEQQFFRETGFMHDPKRCKQCKVPGGRGTRVEEHVICSGCGIDTTVPFKPRGTRPVFCSVCFAKRSQQPRTTVS
jgi:CxxC-x17-CxxC domain-containing protein